MDKETRALFNILTQDIKSIAKTSADNAARLERAYKTFRLDEHEQVIEEKDDRKFVEGTLVRLAQSVDEMARMQRVGMTMTLVDEDTAFFIKKDRQANQTARARRLDKIHALSLLDKREVEKCPCGKHRGIAFKDSDDKRKTVTTMCAIHWWNDMFALRFSEGTHKKFLEEFPHDEYMKRFKLA